MIIQILEFAHMSEVEPIYVAWQLILVRRLVLELIVVSLEELV